MKVGSLVQSIVIDYCYAEASVIFAMINELSDWSVNELGMPLDRLYWQLYAGLGVQLRMRVYDKLRGRTL